MKNNQAEIAARCVLQRQSFEDPPFGGVLQVRTVIVGCKLSVKNSETQAICQDGHCQVTANCQGILYVKVKTVSKIVLCPEITSGGQTQHLKETAKHF